MRCLMRDKKKSHAWGGGKGGSGRGGGEEGGGIQSGKCRGYFRDVGRDEEEGGGGIERYGGRSAKMLR